MMKQHQQVVQWLLVVPWLSVHAWFSGGSHMTCSSTSRENCYPSFGYQKHTSSLPSSSTPFEADFYDSSASSSSSSSSSQNPFEVDTVPLQVPSDTKLCIGLNKYSHDTSLCAADSRTGKVLFAISKERLGKRQKHAAGNVVTLIDTCMESLGLSALENIETVVCNNHHYRILPLEDSANVAHLEWEAGLQINGGTEVGYEEEENIFSFLQEESSSAADADASPKRKMELSHHLAHAYSTATQAPFDDGLIVVMDGMGETYRTMKTAMADDSYFSDFDLLEENNATNMIVLPHDLDTRTDYYYDWREAESVYTFRKDTTANSIQIIPVFKRFQQERTPPTLYNHGFENMQSVGALYSRTSSTIFGDWNACGKVMGLAPWKHHEWKKSSKDDDDNNNDATLRPSQYTKPIVTGKIQDDSLEIDYSLLSGMPLIARNDADLFDPMTMVRRRRYDFDDNCTTTATRPTAEDVDENDDTDDESRVTENSKKRDAKVLPAQVALDAIGVAARMQEDLETVVMDFVQHFQKETAATNLCLAGGVALNSVLNGRLARELKFQETFLSPYPGDDGIAVGCCAFGLFGPKMKKIKGKAKKEAENEKDDTDNVLMQVTSRPPIWRQPLSPYLGPAPTEFQMKLALEAAAPWLDVETIRNPELRIERIVNELISGGGGEGAVVALYQGRSELGPRALGHRSILADPRNKDMVRFINSIVKKRESFRPFAPSVLVEEADKWFDLHVTPTPKKSKKKNNNVSPYMSMTAMVKDSKRSLIPAVTHVDGSSRLQTVTPEAEPFYHALISAFFARTGVPMVLNTSFNTIPSEPIVESPKDAIRSFLTSLGSINVLVMGDYIITRKEADLRRLVGESRDEGVMVTPATPKRTGPVEFKSEFRLHRGVTHEEEVTTVTQVRMPDRIMHHDVQNNWFTMVDELEGEILSICDGTNTVNDIMAYFTTKSNDEEFTEEDLEDTKEIFQQASRRLIRLFEHGFISW